MNARAVSLALILVSIVILSAAPQGQDAAQLSVDRIFSKMEFAAAPTGFSPWLDDGTAYIRLEPSGLPDGGVDIVSYSPGSGTPLTLVKAADLVPPGDTRPLKITAYAFSNDRSRVLITAENRRDRNGGPEYWAADLASRRLVQVGAGTLPGRIVAPQLSPDGRKVGYACEHNLYVEDVSTLKTVQLTVDGSLTRINGDSARQFASELNARGFRWSPDGRRLTYMQLDTEGVKSFRMINNTDSLYPEVVSFQHVKPGEQLPASRAGVVPVDGGKTVWIDIPGDPRMNYLTKLDWAVSSSELVVQQFDRHQNRMTVFLVEATSGKAAPILTESDDAFLDPVDLQWIDGGRRYLWASERDGWRHIYRYSRDGKQHTLLTPGSFDVASVEHIDETGGWIYYLASPDNAIYRYLFRVRLDGSGKVERVTPEGTEGTHAYSISPSARWAFHSYARFDTPPMSEVVSLPDHRPARAIQDNAALRGKLAKVGRTPYEFLKVDIGSGVKLDAFCIKPPDFDPSRKYPVVFQVYSMPGGQRVVDNWGGDTYLFSLLLAQKGFIVMGIDGRGTPSLYGRAWRKIIYKKHGLVPCDDIAAATRVLTAQRPYMDVNRVGVYGWSGGGLMSLLLILRHPDLFQAAVPGAYISSHRFYRAGFTERYLGLPQENPEAYEETAALNYASNLKGHLLLLHGTGDNNVHYQNTEALINKLIAAGKRFAVVPYPNRSHGMTEGENTKYHQYDTTLWFFSEHLLPRGVDEKR